MKRIMKADENQGSMPRSLINHLDGSILRTRDKIFMKKFHGLIQEVWLNTKI